MIGDDDPDEIKKAQKAVEADIAKYGWVRVARWLASHHRERKRRAKNAENWKRNHPAEWKAYSDAYNARRRKEHKEWRESQKKTSQ